MPDFDDFIDHRHDQSVLTICAIGEGIRGLGDALSRTRFCDHDKSIDHVLAKMGVPPVKSVRRLTLLAFVDSVWLLIRGLIVLKLRGVVVRIMNWGRRFSGVKRCWRSRM